MDRNQAFGSRSLQATKSLPLSFYSYCNTIEKKLFSSRVHVDSEPLKAALTLMTIHYLSLAMTGLFEKNKIIGSDMFVSSDRLYVLLVRQPSDQYPPIPEVYVYGKGSATQPLHHIEDQYISEFRQYFERSCSKKAIELSFSAINVAEFNIPNTPYDVFLNDGRGQFHVESHARHFPYKVKGDFREIEPVKKNSPTRHEMKKISPDTMYDENGQPIFQRKLFTYS